MFGCTALVAGGKAKTGEDGSVSWEDFSLVSVVAHLEVGLAIVDECKGATCSWIVKHGLHLKGSGKPHFNLFTQLK